MEGEKTPPFLFLFRAGEEYFDSPAGEPVIPAILVPQVSASRKTRWPVGRQPQLRRIPDRVRGQDMPLVRPSRRTVSASRKTLRLPPSARWTLARPERAKRSDPPGGGCSRPGRPSDC